MILEGQSNIKRVDKFVCIVIKVVGKISCQQRKNKGLFVLFRVLDESLNCKRKIKLKKRKKIYF